MFNLRCYFILSNTYVRSLDENAIYFRLKSHGSFMNNFFYGYKVIVLSDLSAIYEQLFCGR